MTIALRRAEERARARDPARWGIEPAALALAVNADVVAGRDPAGRPSRARRSDLFDALAARGCLGASQLAAVRRLEGDLASLHRSAGVADLRPRVDVSRRAQGIDAGRLAAGRRIEEALALAGGASGRLLRALLEPGAIPWREVVARETGETLADAQGAVVRAACENLALAYAELARRRRNERG